MCFSKLFKKIKCKHEYKYFDTEKYYFNSYSERFEWRYLFVCKNCKKIISISDSEIIDLYQKMVREYKINNVLKQDLKFLPDSIVLQRGKGSMFFSGIPCAMMIDYYQQVGIDLHELESSY